GGARRIGAGRWRGGGWAAGRAHAHAAGGGRRAPGGGPGAARVPARAARRLSARRSRDRGGVAGARSGRGGHRAVAAVAGAGRGAASGPRQYREGMTLTHHAALLRHFADLRDGVHGDATSRADKETLFAKTVELLDPVARQVLAEMNTEMLLDAGTVGADGPTRDKDGGLVAEWALTWPAQ